MATVKYVGPNQGTDDKWIITKADFKNSGDGFDHDAVEFNSQNGFKVTITDPDLAQWLVDSHPEFEMGKDENVPLARRSKEDLVAEAESQGLATDGTKAELIARLEGGDDGSDEGADG